MGVNMEWIDIRDKKPEVGQTVLTFFKITGIEIAEYFHPEPDERVKGLETMDCFQNKAGFLCDDVTHWMPLPEPPHNNSK